VNRSSSPARPPLRRLGVATAAAAALVLVPVAAASAHVRVNPDTTAAGAYAQLTFRVPTESETASTTSLRVELPTGTPFTSVRTKPLPGWTAEVVTGALPAPVDVAGATITEAATAVVWTADPGTGVGPDEYQEFDLSVGPLPEAGTEVLLPAVQTYSDGEVVAWDQPETRGEEPELPAPVLTTTAVEDDGHGHAAAAPGEDDDAAATPGSTSGTASGSASGTDDAARWLGGGALAAAVAAAAAAAVALLRGRRAAGARA